MSYILSFCERKNVSWWNYVLYKKIMFHGTASCCTENTTKTHSGQKLTIWWSRYVFMFFPELAIPHEYPFQILGKIFLIASKISTVHVSSQSLKTFRRNHRDFPTLLCCQSLKNTRSVKTKFKISIEIFWQILSNCFWSGRLSSWRKNTQISSLRLRLPFGPCDDTVWYALRTGLASEPSLDLNAHHEISKIESHVSIYKDFPR